LSSSLDGIATVAIYTPSYAINDIRAALECRAPSKEWTMRAEAQAMVTEIEESLELLRRRL